MDDGLPTGEPQDAAVPSTALDPPQAYGAKYALLIFAAHIFSQFVVSGVVMVAVGVYAGIRATQQGLTAEQTTTYVTSLVEDVGLPLAIALGLAASIAVLLILSAYLIRRQPHPTFAEACGWRLGSHVQLATALGFGAALGSAYIVVAVFVLPFPEDGDLGPLAQMAMRGGWYRLLWGCLAVCVAPALEEFLYRGVLFTGMARSWGVATSATVTVILFTSLHIGEAQYYWPALGFVGLLAITLQMFRMRADAVGPCIALHASYNGVLVVMSSLMP